MRCDDAELQQARGREDEKLRPALPVAGFRSQIKKGGGREVRRNTAQARQDEQEPEDVFPRAHPDRQHCDQGGEQGKMELEIDRIGPDFGRLRQADEDDREKRQEPSPDPQRSVHPDDQEDGDRLKGEGRIGRDQRRILEVRQRRRRDDGVRGELQMAVEDEEKLFERRQAGDMRVEAGAFLCPETPRRQIGVHLGQAEREIYEKRENGISVLRGAGLACRHVTPYRVGTGCSPR